MGKDKTLKQPIEKKTAPIVTTVPDKPVAKAKGHKQKGAGTIITSKPAIITSDGIILKQHERLPNQLLLQYCNKEKKSNPIYQTISNNNLNYKYKIVIPDSKDKNKDVSFIPNQPFESDKIAKEYAALLALFHYQSNLPIERVLPEPFYTTWIQLLNKKNNKYNNIDSNVIDNEVTNTIEVNKADEDNNIINQIEINQSDPNECDWICDYCSTTNFIKLANGLDRKKCFKCHNNKSDNVTLIASKLTNNIDNKLINKIEKTTSKSSTQIDNKTIKKFISAPKPVFQLENENIYLSKAEKEKEELNMLIDKNKTTGFIEAFNKSNKLKEIIINNELTNEINMILSNNQLDSVNSKTNSLTIDNIYNTIDEELDNQIDISTANNFTSFWDKQINENTKVVNKQSTNYINNLNNRKLLPAWNMRELFLTMLSTSRALIVTGETGCGKTTQIPQYINESNPLAKVVICQPRRLAAIGVATRVAEEVDCKLGKLVGYIVKDDSCIDNYISKLVFCTYGILLRRLQFDPLLRGIDYIILDEIHERNIDSDFALALLLLTMEQRSDLKLILMSATISSEKFVDYLSNNLSTNSIPVLHIPGFTYPVNEFYKNDFNLIVKEKSTTYLSKYISFQISKYKDRYSDSPSDNQITNYDIRNYKIGGLNQDDIDYDLIIRLLYTLIYEPLTNNPLAITNNMFDPIVGTVLIFMPGQYEIKKLSNLIEEVYQLVECNNNSSYILKVYQLHSNTSIKEQKLLFQNNQIGSNIIRVIVSTNIAETSITIPDVTAKYLVSKVLTYLKIKSLVIIDTCLVKEIQYNNQSYISTLSTVYTSTNSCRQRKGRAGRNQKGRYYCLLTNKKFGQLNTFNQPEILRTPIYQLILQIYNIIYHYNKHQLKSLTIYDISNKCIDPPTITSISHTINYLIKLNAINKSNCITNLGIYLSTLPCDPKIGKLLVYGWLFGYIDVSCMLGSIISNKDIYINAIDKNNKINFIDRMINSLKLESKLHSKIDNQSGSRLAEPLDTKLDKKSTKSNPIKPLTTNQLLDILSDELIYHNDHLLTLITVYLYNNSSNKIKFCNDNNLSIDIIKQVLITSNDFKNHILVLSTNKIENRIENIDINVINILLYISFYPLVSLIIYPPIKYNETIGGTIEKSIDSKDIQMYISNDIDSQINNTDTYLSDEISFAGNYLKSISYQRVYTHSSSLLYDKNTYLSNYLLYTSTYHLTSNISKDKSAEDKVYIRDLIDINTISLLLFCGSLDEITYNQTTNTCVICNFIRLKIDCELLSLLFQLRRQLDELITRKLNDTSIDISNHPILQLIWKLIDSSKN